MDARMQGLYNHYNHDIAHNYHHHHHNDRYQHPRHRRSSCKQCQILSPWLRDVTFAMSGGDVEKMVSRISSINVSLHLTVPVGSLAMFIKQCCAVFFVSTVLLASCCDARKIETRSFDHSPRTYNRVLREVDNSSLNSTTNSTPSHSMYTVASTNVSLLSPSSSPSPRTYQQLSSASVERAATGSTFPHEQATKSDLVALLISTLEKLQVLQATDSACLRLNKIVQANINSSSSPSLSVNNNLFGVTLYFEEVYAPSVNSSTLANSNMSTSPSHSNNIVSVFNNTCISDPVIEVQRAVVKTFYPEDEDNNSTVVIADGNSSTPKSDEGVLHTGRLSRTQIVVISTCSSIIGMFFIVAAILRIRNYIKRARMEQEMAKRPKFRSCSVALRGATQSMEQLRRDSLASKASHQNSDTTKGSSSSQTNGSSRENSSASSPRHDPDMAPLLLLTGASQASNQSSPIEPQTTLQYIDEDVDSSRKKITSSASVTNSNINLDASLKHCRQCNSEKILDEALNSCKRGPKTQFSGSNASMPSRHNRQSGCRSEGNVNPSFSNGSIGYIFLHEPDFSDSGSQKKLSYHLNTINKPQGGVDDMPRVFAQTRNTNLGHGKSLKLSSCCAKDLKNSTNGAKSNPDFMCRAHESQLEGTNVHKNHRQLHKTYSDVPRTTAVVGGSSPSSILPNHPGNLEKQTKADLSREHCSDHSMATDIGDKLYPLLDISCFRFAQPGVSLPTVTDQGNEFLGEKEYHYTYQQPNGLQACKKDVVVDNDKSMQTGNNHFKSVGTDLNVNKLIQGVPECHCANSLSDTDRPQMQTGQKFDNRKCSSLTHTSQVPGNTLVGSVVNNKEAVCDPGIQDLTVAKNVFSKISRPHTCTKHPQKSGNSAEMLDQNSNMLILQPCTPAGEVMQQCTPADEVIQPCTPADEVIQPCTPVDEVIQPCTPADEVIQSCTPADEVIQPCTPADEVIQPCTPADEVIQPCTPADEVIQSCTPDGEVMQPCTPVGEVMQSCTSADEVIQPCTPADEVMQPCTPADEVIQPCTPADEVIQSCTPADEVIQPCTPADEVIQSCTPADEIMQLCTSAGVVMQSCTSADEVKQSCTPAGEVMQSCTSAAVVMQSCTSADEVMQLCTQADVTPSEVLQSGTLDDVTPSEVLQSSTLDDVTPSELLQSSTLDDVTPSELLQSSTLDDVTPSEVLQSSTLDDVTPSEVLQSCTLDDVTPSEVLQSCTLDDVTPSEVLQSSTLDDVTPSELLQSSTLDDVTPSEVLQSSTLDDVTPSEVLQSSTLDDVTPSEVLQSSTLDDVTPSELLQSSTLDDVTPSEVLQSSTLDDVTPSEVLQSCTLDDVTPSEVLQSATLDDVTPSELLQSSTLDDVTPSEVLQSCTLDDVTPSEVLQSSTLDDVTPSEVLQSATLDDVTPSEVLQSATLDDVTPSEVLLLNTPADVTPGVLQSSTLDDVTTSEVLQSQDHVIPSGVLQSCTLDDVTPCEVLQSATLDDVTPSEVLQSGTLDDVTPSEVLQSCTLDDVTPSEVLQSATLDDVTPSEVLQSCTLDDVTPSEVLQSCTLDDVTPSEVLQSCTLDDVTPSEVLQSCTLDDVTPSEVLQSSTLDDVTTSEVLQSSTLDDVTPSEVLQSSTLDDVTPSEVLQSSTLDDVTPSEVLQSSTLDDVTTSEVLQSQDHVIPSGVLQSCTLDDVTPSEVLQSSTLDDVTPSEVLQSSTLDDVTPSEVLQSGTLDDVTPSEVLQSSTLDDVTPSEVLQSFKPTDVTQGLPVKVLTSIHTQTDEDLFQSLQETVDENVLDDNVLDENVFLKKNSLICEAQSELARSLSDSLDTFTASDSEQSSCQEVPSSAELSGHFVSMSDYYPTSIAAPNVDPLSSDASSWQSINCLGPGTEPDQDQVIDDHERNNNSLIDVNNRLQINGVLATDPHSPSVNSNDLCHQLLSLTTHNQVLNSSTY